MEHIISINGTYHVLYNTITLFHIVLPWCLAKKNRFVTVPWRAVSGPKIQDSKLLGWPFRTNSTRVPCFDLGHFDGQSWLIWPFDGEFWWILQIEMGWNVTQTLLGSIESIWYGYSFSCSSPQSQEAEMVRLCALEKRPRCSNGDGYASVNLSISSCLWCLWQKAVLVDLVGRSSTAAKLKCCGSTILPSTLPGCCGYARCQDKYNMDRKW